MIVVFKTFDNWTALRQTKLLIISAKVNVVNIGGD